MRYPNQRYAPVSHLQHEAIGWTTKQLARHLKRDERTIRNWMSGRLPVPWWVPEILRLERYEKNNQLRSMLSMNLPLARLGIVTGEKIVHIDTMKVTLKNLPRRKIEEEKRTAEIADKEELDQMLKLKMN